MNKQADVCHCGHPRSEHGSAGCFGFRIPVDPNDPQRYVLCLCGRFRLWLTADEAARHPD